MYQLLREEEELLRMLVEAAGDEGTQASFTALKVADRLTLPDPRLSHDISVMSIHYSALQALERQRLVAFSSGSSTEGGAFGVTADGLSFFEASNVTLQRDTARQGDDDYAHDVFICHASEDKQDFVRPLFDALVRRGLRVWYDDFALVPGSSLGRSIDEGLRGSRYGVVVLSKAFFTKSWPQSELDGLEHRQLGAGERLILPVWHGVTSSEVAKFSPRLAGTVGIRAEAVEDVADAILKVVQSEGSNVGPRGPTDVSLQDVRERIDENRAWLQSEDVFRRRASFIPEERDREYLERRLMLLRDLQTFRDVGESH